MDYTILFFFCGRGSCTFFYPQHLFIFDKTAQNKNGTKSFDQ